QAKAPPPAPGRPQPAAALAQLPPQVVPASAKGNGGAEARAAAHGANRIFSSPLARRLAKEAGIELSRIQGSGPHGRVIARDVEAAKSGKGLIAPAAAPGAAAVVQAPSDDKIRALFEAGSYEAVAHDNVRKVIARRLMEAKLTIPHFYLTLDCAIGRLL